MRFLILLLALALCSAASAQTVAVFPYGSQTVTVPAAQFINVFSTGTVSVFKQVGGVNVPATFTLETNGSFTGQESIFGPYTVSTQVRIDTQAETAFYRVGSGAIALPVQRPSPALTASTGAILRIPTRIAYSQPTPTAKTVAVTLTIAELLTGLITGSHTAGATQAYTLPTGALMDTALPLMQINDAFEWVLINNSAAAADSITVTAGVGHTIVGSPIVISTHVTTGGSITSQGCNSSTWITQKTAAATYVTYRKN